MGKKAKARKRGTSETLGLPFRLREAHELMPEPKLEKNQSCTSATKHAAFQRETGAANDNNRMRIDCSCIVRGPTEPCQDALQEGVLVPQPFQTMPEEEFDASEIETRELPTLILRLRHVMQPVFVRFLTSFLCLPAEIMLFGSEVGAIGNLGPAAMGARGPPTY